MLIFLYRDEPILHSPFNFLSRLMDVDELFTSWRQRHALMVRRMIGSKIGTGGSSGHAYLKSTADIFDKLTSRFNDFPDVGSVTNTGYILP